MSSWGRAYTHPLLAGRAWGGPRFIIRMNCAQAWSRTQGSESALGNVKRMEKEEAALVCYWKVLAMPSY